MTPKHLVHQFKLAIHDALISSTETRALMRARSAKQRFPVAQWVEDLDTLQSTSIKISEEENYEKKSLIDNLKSPSMTNIRTLFNGGMNSSRNSLSGRAVAKSLLSPTAAWSPRPEVPPRPHSPLGIPQVGSNLEVPQPAFASEGDGSLHNRMSVLSYDSVAGGREDFALQKVDPSFTDATGVFARAFEKKLEQLDSKSSENLLCIEDNLVKSVFPESFSISFFQILTCVQVKRASSRTTETRRWE